MDRLLSVKEAAQLLSCSEAAIRKWVYQRRLPHASDPLSPWRRTPHPDGGDALISPILLEELSSLEERLCASRELLERGELTEAEAIEFGEPLIARLLALLVECGTPAEIGISAEGAHEFRMGPDFAEWFTQEVGPFEGTF
jgi:hypothetical protein